MQRQALVVAALGLLAACGRKNNPPPRSSESSGGMPAPSAPAMQAQGPTSYRIRFETSAGPFVVEVTRAWSPRGADRLYNLVSHGFYDGERFFRVVPGFVAQFGIPGDPRVAAAWRTAAIADDPVMQHNVRGTLTFATAGPNTRTTQLFINLADNTQLDGEGFSPVGRVVEGMDAVDRIYSAYGESPDQGRVQMEGNTYLTAEFPKLDSIARATIVAP
jgi:peptidyl-prolyl cis-trans isomerase A (cyclophilin A)